MNLNEKALQRMVKEVLRSLTAKGATEKAAIESGLAKAFGYRSYNALLGQLRKEGATEKVTGSKRNASLPAAETEPLATSVLLEFVHVPEARTLEDVGPFAWVQERYGELVGYSDAFGEVVIASKEGSLWSFQGLVYTDVIIAPADSVKLESLGAATFEFESGPAVRVAGDASSAAASELSTVDLISWLNAEEVSEDLLYVAACNDANRYGHNPITPQRRRELVSQVEVLLALGWSAQQIRNAVESERASIAALAAYLERCGVGPENLDEAVYTAVDRCGSARPASSINNGGLEDQIEYLTSCDWTASDIVAAVNEDGVELDSQMVMALPGELKMSSGSLAAVDLPVGAVVEFTAGEHLGRTGIVIRRLLVQVQVALF